MDHLRGYENVGHVLGVLAETHEELARAIGELGDHSSDERRKMILGYLADQQSRRAADLAMYQRDAKATLLEQWLQIPFPENPSKLIASLRAQGSASIDVDELLSETDGFMERLLTHLEDRAETSNAKALFHDLLEIDNREKHLRSRALASFAQI